MLPVARQVNYGSERIDFLLSRRPRKTLAITVHPDLRVEVVAPLDADEAADWMIPCEISRDHPNCCERAMPRSSGTFRDVLKR